MARLTTCLAAALSLAAFGADDPREALGWVTGTVVAPALVAGSPSGLADWLTDRIARRPSGVSQREQWASMHQDAGGHRGGFDAILDALRPGPGDHLLDIGPGSGVLIREALERGATASAIDHSADMVRVTRETNADAVADGRLTVEEGDAAKLPYPDGSFTRVALAHVFFFLPDPLAVLRESYRVLREGGRLAAFTIPPSMRGHPHAAPEPIASRMFFYEDDELERLAREAGFEHVTVSSDPNGGQLLVAERRAAGG
jgi:SAM-dependent methyltransferase